MGAAPVRRPAACRHLETRCLSGRQCAHHPASARRHTRRARGGAGPVRPDPVVDERKGQPSPIRQPPTSRPLLSRNMIRTVSTVLAAERSPPGRTRRTAGSVSHRRIAVAARGSIPHACGSQPDMPKRLGCRSRPQRWSNLNEPGRDRPRTSAHRHRCDQIHP